MERLQAIRRWWRDIGRRSDQELDERFYEADGVARRLAINAVFLIMLGGLISLALVLPDQISRAAVLGLFSGWAVVLIVGYVLTWRIGMWRQRVDVRPSTNPATSFRQLALSAPLILITWLAVHFVFARGDLASMDWASLGGALVGFVIAYGVILLILRGSRRATSSEQQYRNLDGRH